MTAHADVVTDFFTGGDNNTDVEDALEAFNGLCACYSKQIGCRMACGDVIADLGAETATCLSNATGMACTQELCGGSAYSGAMTNGVSFFTLLSVVMVFLFGRAN
jgi:hypothetical protein